MVIFTRVWQFKPWDIDRLTTAEFDIYARAIEQMSQQQQ